VIARTAWRRCPYCGVLHDGVTDVELAQDDAHDGDASICIDCGGVAVFDSTGFGGLREPTAAESATFARDPRIAAAVIALRIANERDR
jgi:hypothetical protein